MSMHRYCHSWPFDHIGHEQLADLCGCYTELERGSYRNRYHHLLLDRSEQLQCRRCICQYHERNASSDWDLHGYGQ